MTAQEIISLLSKVPHKDGVDPTDWQRVHPELLNLAHFFLTFCTAHRLPALISSIIRPKIKGQSETDIHAHGRAFDASVRGWSVDDLDDILIECNKVYALRIGAYRVSESMDGLLIPRAVIYEYGQGDCVPKATDFIKMNGATAHLHFQVRIL